MKLTDEEKKEAVLLYRIGFICARLDILTYYQLINQHKELMPFGRYLHDASLVRALTSVDYDYLLNWARTTYQVPETDINKMVAELDGHMNNAEFVNALCQRYTQTKVRH